MDAAQGLREAPILRRLGHQLGECDRGWDLLQLAADLETRAHALMDAPESPR
jgi:hypothetical protein